MFGIEEEQFQKMVDSLTSVALPIMPRGLYLYKIAEEIYKDGAPLRIVETGCLRDTRPSAWVSDGWSTWYLSKFASTHPNVTVTTIESDAMSRAICKEFLAEQKLPMPTFLAGNSEDFLAATPADFYFLDSCNGLDHGLLEFQLALAHKPKVIVMDDPSTKALTALTFANQAGIANQQMGQYLVFHPQHGN